MVGGAGGRWAVTGVLAEERQPEGTGAEGLLDCVKRDVMVTERRGGGPEMGPGEAGCWWPGLGGGGAGKAASLGAAFTHKYTRVCTTGGSICTRLTQRDLRCHHPAGRHRPPGPSARGATASQAPAVPIPGRHCVLRDPARNRRGRASAHLLQERCLLSPPE